MLAKKQPASDALHARIRHDIENAIVSGAWPPGHRIPYEHELMQTYGCARMTVNKALSALSDAGLIERRRRAGSFVAQPRFHSAVLHIPDIPADVRKRGFDYALTLLTSQIRRATKSDQDSLALVTPCNVLALRCLHRANGKPFALEHRLINLDVVPDARGVDFNTEAPGSWLLAQVPWSEASHRIYAQNPSAEDARDLAIVRSNACLVIERRTWRSDDPITFARQIFPGALYEVDARFTPF
ncbi:MAG: histidine utilization repressor [Beijerinckiaceae bacterium]